MEKNLHAHGKRPTYTHMYAQKNYINNVLPKVRKENVTSNLTQDLT